jgi:hypothetical protein
VEHGTFSNYTTGACRCQACKEAARKYHYAYRRRAEKKLTHGTCSSYVAGCRCGKCREAHLDYCNAWRASKKARK